MERRELLTWMVSAGGLTALSRLSVLDLIAIGDDAHRRARPVFRTLDARTATSVTLAAELILPATDTPGATQANVTAFIDTMLTGWYPPADRDRFLAGVHDLDMRARAQYGRAFAECATAEQLALLEVSDAEVTALRATDGTAANEHWFAMLKYLTVWGYCTSEIGMRDTLQVWPMPMHYDGNAKVGA